MVGRAAKAGRFRPPLVFGRSSPSQEVLSLEDDCWTRDEGAEPKHRGPGLEDLGDDDVIGQGEQQHSDTENKDEEGIGQSLVSHVA